MSPLERYLNFGLKSVDGWLAKYSAEFITALSGTQQRAGYTGAIGEIGVHHGKLFILLLMLASSSEKAFVIDVFENQELNTDRSGCGDRAIFLQNVRRWSGPCAQVEIIAKSSLDVRVHDVLASCGNARLLSIDGGHTEECTLNDLRLAEDILHDQGVAIVDDCFNQEWPDVSTGVSRYLTDHNSRLRPFAISPNKVYFSDRNSSEFYRSEMRKVFVLDKESRMYGCAVDLYGTRPPEQTLAWFIKERLKESALGPRLLAIKAFLEGRPSRSLLRG